MDNNLTEKINEIRQQADIVDIVSRHIIVVKKGRNFFAICPFHNDTNPSLSISKDKQIFKCFVCNEAGNVFTFLQKYKKIPYMKAVKEVADIIGVDFKLSEGKQTEVINIRHKVLYDILKDATLFYKNALFSNEDAYKYCQIRNLPQDIIDNFSIGYSPDYDKLISFLLAKGYKKEDIYNSGIAIEVDGKLKDRFANRLVFPICDLNGKVVAFSGRIIQQSDMAKYVNSPETEIFIKGNTLYNYSNALEHIKKEKKMYVCEGFMDCIALSKANIKNAVALMGTAFTKEHLKVFKYLGVEIILTLDGDNPGNINAIKLANVLLDFDVNVSVVPHYDDVKDIDEYLSKYGNESLINHLNNNLMAAFDFNFYVASKLDELENNENKKKFLKKMCSKIARMSMEDIDIYSNKLHNELGFSLTTINTLINSYKQDSKDEVVQNVKKYKKLSKYQDLQLRVLSQMLDSPEAIEIFIENLVYLQNESYRKISFMIGEYYKENKETFNMEHLIADLFTKVSTDFADDDELIKTLTFIDDSKEKYPSYNKASFEDLLFEIQEIAPLEERLEQINEEIKFANSTMEKSDFIRNALALKQLIAEKRAKKMGG
ncbi:MAG: DNA primase [Bacilli bacterium]|nr:DNA primase [Bacilli bacterium]